MKNTLAALAALSLLLAAGCKKDEGKGKHDGKSSGSSKTLAYGKVVLTSDTLADSQTPLTALTAKDCGFQMDIYSGEGSCITPLSVTGYARAVGLAVSSVGNTPYEAANARILAEGDDSESKGEIIPGGAFDFADPSKGLVGNNDLWQQYSHKTTFEYVSAELAYVQSKFALKDKFVTMLIAASDQPFAEAEAVKNCVPAEKLDQQRYQEANLLPGMTFKRGDYLFCVKDSADAACAAEDFKWYDLDTNTLVATRPSNPRHHDYLVDKDKIECHAEGGDRYNFTINGLRVAGKMDAADKFKLYADFSHGELSNQWKDKKHPLGAEPTGGEDEAGPDPYLIYYYQKEGGEIESGSNLQVKLNFTATEMVYIDGLRESDLNSKTVEEILKHAFTKQDWVFQKKAEGDVTGHGVEQYWSMKVVPTITISGGTEPPTPIAE